MAVGSSALNLDTAVHEARVIRYRLLRSKGWKSGLAGACGLSSILLSMAVHNVDILRGGQNHVWAEIEGTIIDITATQFDDDIGGVLVTRTPRYYHKENSRGRSTYMMVINNNWYNNKDHPDWERISEYWL